MSERERTAMEIISEDMEQLRAEAMKWKRTAMNLLDRYKTFKASYQQAQLTIAGLEAERDHYHKAAAAANFVRSNIEHAQCKAALAAAVEVAFREGYEAFSDAAYVEGGGDFVVTTTADAAWLASDARKGVARDDQAR